MDAKCNVQGCNEDRMWNRANTRQHTKCVTHMREYWTGHKSAPHKDEKPSSPQRPPATVRNRTCSQCKRRYPADQFPLDFTGKPGNTCRTCTAMIEAARKAPPTNRRTTAHAVPSEPISLVLIDPDTNMAAVYDCVPRPLIYKVPSDATEFSRQLSASQSHGHIIAWRMSEVIEAAEASHVSDE